MCFCVLISSRLSHFDAEPPHVELPSYQMESVKENTIEVQSATSSTKFLDPNLYIKNNF